MVKRFAQITWSGARVQTCDSIFAPNPWFCTPKVFTSRTSSSFQQSPQNNSRPPVHKWGGAEWAGVIPGAVGHEGPFPYMDPRALSLRDGIERMQYCHPHAWSANPLG